jgi:hypothetical protein
LVSIHYFTRKKKFILIIVGPDPLTQKKNPQQVAKYVISPGTEKGNSREVVLRKAIQER